MHTAATSKIDAIQGDTLDAWYLQWRVKSSEIEVGWSQCRGVAQAQFSSFPQSARHICDRNTCSTSLVAFDNTFVDSITHHGVPPPETLCHHGNPQARSAQGAANRHTPRLPQHATQAAPAPVLVQSQRPRGLSIAACREIPADVPPLVPAGSIQPGRAGRLAPAADVWSGHLWSHARRHQLYLQPGDARRWRDAPL
jgi:hypothetical protein